MSLEKPLGGFLELTFPKFEVQNNVLAFWGIPQDEISGFSNARSALAALLKKLCAKRIFLPAYICDSVVSACEGLEVIYYGLDEELNPNTSFLKASVSKNDVVLAVNYFGRGVSIEFSTFVKKHPDVSFIEDCSQAFNTGKPIWGDWRIFSARKLCGVADGGYAVSKTESLVTNGIDKSTDKRWKAAFLRFEDTETRYNCVWHEANQHRENAECISQSPVSRLTHELLLRSDQQQISIARKENYKVLYEQLSAIAFIGSTRNDFVPFGFPVRLPSEQRDELYRQLISKNIFASIHWHNLPSPANHFPNEHRVSKEILTLPCDQRYTAQDMMRIYTAVQAILQI